MKLIRNQKINDTLKQFFNLKILIVDTNSADHDASNESQFDNKKNSGLNYCLNFKSFKEKLDSATYDIILSVHKSGRETTQEYLQHARAKFSFIPFIVIDSTINQEVVYELLRSGINDHLMMENLSRLPFIIERACAEYKNKLKNSARDVASDSNEMSSSKKVNSEILRLTNSYKEINNIERINHALIEGKSILEISSIILSALCDTAEIGYSRIYLYSEKKHKLHLYAQKVPSTILTKLENKIGTAIDKFIPELTGNSIFDMVIKEQKKFITEDEKVIEEIMLLHAPDSAPDENMTWAFELLGIKTFGLYPLIEKNKIVGLLSINSSATLSEQKKKTIQRYATHAAMVLSRKQDIDRLAESEFRFTKIFESIKDVYYQTSLDGIITLISPSVQDLLGYTQAELIGKPIVNFYVDPTIRHSKISTLIDDGCLDEFEAVFKTKSGGQVVLSIQLNLVQKDQLANYSVQGLMRNITEKKKQEVELENQRKKLIDTVNLNTQIVKTSDHFSYVLTVELKSEHNYEIKYLSPQVRTIFGLSEYEILIKKDRWLSFIHVDDRQKITDANNRIFQTKKPLEISYRIFNQATGACIWVDDYAYPLLDDYGNVIEIYGTLKDVSERKNAMEKIEMEKRQSSLHEFQLLCAQLNPHFIYNTLNSFQYYILNGNIETALNHISEFSNLIRKVLENSTSNQITLEAEINFIKQYIEISKTRMKQELLVEIVVDPKIEITEHYIPPMVLQPYVENAIIHGFFDNPKKAVLKISFSKRNDRTFCTLEDNGIGRAKSRQRKKIMEPFAKESSPIDINKKRIHLLNQNTNRNFNVEIIDLMNDSGDAEGTRVVIDYLAINPSGL